MAAAILLVTRTIDAEEAFAFVQGRLLILIFSMLAIGAGLHHAGAVALVVEALTPVIAGLSPFLLIWCFFSTDLAVHRTCVKQCGGCDRNACGDCVGA